ncbi:hypothetical protein CYMTET_38015 [Cymbomonas tetramitiformis]|uniref:Uncharacterized protein n=1 Tax=Cymbomonas tetramitiformis TaxID=36881 RepID=A0AAE0F5W2_9CHLO|nr:hypothetical protein CYMTET_38015 [Cymbomonas tetramitiformis]
MFRTFMPSHVQVVKISQVTPRCELGERASVPKKSTKPALGHRDARPRAVEGPSRRAFAAAVLALTAAKEAKAEDKKLTLINCIRILSVPAKLINKSRWLKRQAAEPGQRVPCVGC